jgi:hypothetical protein
MISEIEALPVTDAHEHLRGHDQCQPREGATDFLVGFYLASILPQADQQLAAKILDGRRDDRQRWQDLAQIWPLMRATGYGRVVSLVLESWGLEPDITPANFTESPPEKNRSPSFPGWHLLIYPPLIPWEVYLFSIKEEKNKEPTPIPSKEGNYFLSQLWRGFPSSPLPGGAGGGFSSFSPPWRGRGWVLFFLPSLEGPGVGSSCHPSVMARPALPADFSGR